MKEVFHMSIQEIKPDPRGLERQHTRRRRRSLGKRLGAFAVAAAIGLVACSGPGDTPRVENATTPGPAEAPETKAEEVATGFIEAYGAFDVEQAITYLADDADISGMIASVGAQGVEGTLKEFRLLISLLEAQGYKQMLNSCEELGSSAADSTLRCTFDFHSIRSDEIGKGSFSDSSFLLTVREGEIVRASKHFAIEEFSPQMWEPFASWVSTAYPEDAAVMYEDESYSGARLTEESTRLWEQRSREYVEVETPKLVEIAESFMEARNAYDAEKAMSLLADDGATVKLMYDNAMDPNLWTVRLGRDELALALEAERLYEVRYESSECRQRDPDRVGVGEAQIVCSYLMDNKLRQIHGFPPVESSFRIGVRDNRIHYLSFPWLNVGFPEGTPAEGGRFVRWLEAEHPEAGGPFDRGELLRTEGQEVVHIFTRESLDLLAGYLAEYERSRNG
jgi:hypothetical protein